MRVDNGKNALTCRGKSVTIKYMENITQAKPNKKEKIIAFFNRNSAMFFAPLFVGVLYIFALFQYGVYPFGNSYTAASYDLSAQIAPFVEHLFDVFDGKSTLTFSYAIVGGADVTGTFLYFFVSPFSFLFLIFGDGKVAEASSIVMLFKLMAISVAGTWFAKKLFQGIPDYLCIAVGVVYTYCGYTFVANTYINWMDFLIYLPFCVGAFKHFVKTNKFLPFSILVACCVYTCFSIACFSLFTVYPALVGYGLICVEKERRSKFIAYMSLSFAVAIFMALPILFPALGAYSVSGRGGSLFENLWKGFSVNSTTGAIENFNSSTFLSSYAQSLYRKWSYILSDSVFVALTLIWLCRKGLKDKLARFMLVAGVLTLLPTVVDESMNLLNMGSYMSYALRFGFLNALYFLGGACLCIEGWCYKPHTAYDGTSLLRNLPKACAQEEPSKREAPLSAQNTQAELVQLAEEMSEILAEITEESSASPIEAPPSPSAEEYPCQTAENPQIEAPEILVAEREVKEQASAPERQKEGGMSATNGIFCKENAPMLIWAGALIFLALAVFVFLIWFSYGNNYKKIAAWFGSEAKYFSSSFAHSLGGLDIIIAPFVVVTIVTFVGAFLVSGKKISPRLLSFALIAVVGLQVLFYNEQLVVGNRSTQHVMLDSYERLNEELNSRDDGYFRVKDYDDKMTACAPFTAGSNSFSVFSSVIDADNFVTFQLFGYKGNGKNSYKSAHNTDKRNRSDEFGDSFLGYKYFISTKSDLHESDSKKSYVKPVYALDENGNVLLDKEGNKVHLKDGDLYVYENEIVFPLGYRVQKGGYRFVKENINNRNNRRDNQKALYGYLSGEDLLATTGSSYVTPTSARKLSNILHEKAAQVEVSAGKITAKVTAQAGEDLMLNFVAVKGYSVTVNGKKAELIDNDLKFLLVALEEGENEVVFTYSSPYVKYALAGVGAGAVLLLLVALAVKKTKIVEVIAPVISWVGVLLAVGVVAFFMIFPTGVFITKLVELVKLLVVT